MKVRLFNRHEQLLATAEVPSIIEAADPSTAFTTAECETLAKKPSPAIIILRNGRMFDQPYLSDYGDDEFVEIDSTSIAYPHPSQVQFLPVQEETHSTPFVAEVVRNLDKIGAPTTRRAQHISFAMSYSARPKHFPPPEVVSAKELVEAKRVLVEQIEVFRTKLLNYANAVAAPISVPDMSIANMLRFVSLIDKIITSTEEAPSENS